LPTIRPYRITSFKNAVVSSRLLAKSTDQVVTTTMLSDNAMNHLIAGF
jgi:hypothetical protein